MINSFDLPDISPPENKPEVAIVLRLDFELDQRGRLRLSVKREDGEFSTSTIEPIPSIWNIILPRLNGWIPRPTTTIKTIEANSPCYIIVILSPIKWRLRLDGQAVTTKTSQDPKSLKYVNPIHSGFIDGYEKIWPGNKTTIEQFPSIPTDLIDFRVAVFQVDRISPKGNPEQDVLNLFFDFLPIEGQPLPAVIDLQIKNEAP